MGPEFMELFFLIEGGVPTSITFGVPKSSPGAHMRTQRSAPHVHLDVRTTRLCPDGNTKENKVTSPPHVPPSPSLAHMRTQTEDRRKSSCCS
uniref:Uncharacterized protein n=1 Tax=Echinococcus canadensis TaxID=519352 RepID=A0A915EWH9_9CEST